MIIQADVTGLEVLVTAFNSQDKMLYKELEDKLNIHSDNQEKFELPDRDTAKRFVFKLLYGASAHGFANDPDFTFISSTPKYWQNVIDKYYEKYQGVYKWHTSILQEAGRTGKLTSPSGRIYEFPLTPNYKGELKLPATKIKNYLTQGFGSDIMAVARVSFMRRFKNANIDGLIINTVHDSIVVDVPSVQRGKVVNIFNDVFRDLPANVSKIFNISFDLEIRCEILAGNNQYDLTKF